MIANEIKLNNVLENRHLLSVAIFVYSSDKVENL